MYAFSKVNRSKVMKIVPKRTLILKLFILITNKKLDLNRTQKVLAKLFAQQ
jgi:hypothetical protein